MTRRYCPSELSSEQKANFLIGHLDGVAREKVEELDEGARKSFDAVVTHLRNFFESPQQRYVARQKLSVCKQEPGEAAANRVLNLVRSATAGQDPATQKDRVLEEFVSRLRGDIRYFVKLDNPASFEQAVTKAQMVEQLLSEATAERLISPEHRSNSPATAARRTYLSGSVLQLRRTWSPCYSLPVSVSPSICEFRVSDADLDEIVTAISRSNVSCAMRFSEFPASKEAQRTLCALVRNFLPAHPEEGLLPLRVFKLTRSEREWINDRAGNFDNYRAHPRSAQQYMAQLFNAACLALAAVNHMNDEDEERTHMLDAVIPDIEAFPFRFDFTLADMSSECGWTNQRPVYLWIVGSRSLLRTIIQQAVHSFEDRSIAVRLVVPAWAHRYAVRATARRARTRDNVTTVRVCVRLAPPPFGAEPLYELISQSQLFGEFPENSQATAVLNAIYGQQRIEAGPDGPQHENVSVSVGGRSFTLREDQVAALRMSERRLPILAIQAAFGTGKTVVGALIAARTFSKFQERVIATTSTNTAVAQLTDT
ncbi:hypothetical protein V3C99_018103 [Haemonchus contortus]